MTSYTKLFKKYKKNGTYNGMTANEVLDLELEIYSRLSKYTNFPKIISYDLNSITLTLEYCGESIHTLRENNCIIDVENVDDQIDNICNSLLESKITYLDLDPHNLCIKDKTIFLIDFDKAVIDQKPTSNAINEMYLNFMKSVSSESFKKTMKEYIINPSWPRYQFVL
jgi:tRNA A-37 threonylcarbamoyl transferase component Bud32